MIDIIIATNNRIPNARDLANSMLSINGTINKVILVDSSDGEGIGIIENKSIVFVKTKHKNQPYQRYLGYLASDADILLFLDDDMVLLDNSILSDLEEYFNNVETVAVNLLFQNNNSFLAKQPKGLISNKNKFKNIAGYFSGYPLARPNQYLFCGIRGERVANLAVEFLCGGAFAVKRADLYKKFNMQLFTIYENKLGKGEDGILGYTLSKIGIIECPEKAYFLHRDLNDSSYAINQYTFSRRLIFSRLFLSCEYYRLKGRSPYFGLFRFHHYAIGRILGCVISFLVFPSQQRLTILKGYISGYFKSFFFRFDSKLVGNNMWINETRNEASNNKY